MIRYHSRFLRVGSEETMQHLFAKFLKCINYDVRDGLIKVSFNQTLLESLRETFIDEPEYQDDERHAMKVNIELLIASTIIPIFSIEENIIAYKNTTSDQALRFFLGRMIEHAYTRDISLQEFSMPMDISLLHSFNMEENIKILSYIYQYALTNIKTIINVSGGAGMTRQFIDSLNRIIVIEKDGELINTIKPITALYNV